MVLTFHNLSINAPDDHDRDELLRFITEIIESSGLSMEYDSVTNSTDVVAEILPDSPETTNPEDSKPFGKDDMAMLIWKEMHGL